LKIKVLVVTPRFTISGVSLAQRRFARALAAAGHRVDLMIGRVDADLVVPETPGVRVIPLQRPNVRGMLLPLWRYFRGERPDLVFSAEDHLNAITLIAAILAGSKARISGSCRVRPFDTYSSVPFTKRWFLKQVMRLVGWRANALTCVSRDMVDQYRDVFQSPRHAHAYNIVDDAEARARMNEPVDDPWLVDRASPVIVAAGQLQPWKGFSDLIDAMAELDRRGRDVRLIILGEGPLRSELEDQLRQLGLADKVKLPGTTDNPLKYFRHADAFVLSSKVEGMPNVLVEAMMCGCTPVATDCPTGPRELLQDGRFGHLVPVGDAGSMASGIELALDRPIAVKELRQAVRPFSEEAVIQRHFELLGLAGQGRNADRP
jgi:glycosyltransferase involved in cell wall biosynthesis